MHGRYLYALLAVTVGAFLGAAGLTGVMFYFFNPQDSDCSFNITAIVCTLLIGLIMSAISMSTYVGPLELHITVLLPAQLCQMLFISVTSVSGMEMMHGHSETVHV